MDRFESEMNTAGRPRPVASISSLRSTLSDWVYVMVMFGVQSFRLECLRQSLLEVCSKKKCLLQSLHEVWSVLKKQNWEVCSIPLSTNFVVATQERCESPEG